MPNGRKPLAYARPHRTARPQTGRIVSGRARELLGAVWQALTVARESKAVVMARAGVVINANGLACQLFGRPLDGLVGCDILGELLAHQPNGHIGAPRQRWETALRVPSGEAIPVEVTREVLDISHADIEVFAIRDLRQRHEAAKEHERSLRRDEELEAQNLRFEMALTSLSTGLCVFDAERRLVVCNEPYLRMYQLSADEVKPGTSLGEILQQRIVRGLYSGASPEDFIRERLDVVADQKPTRNTHTFADGRIVNIGHHPIPGGGWIATHEDITEQRHMEAALARSNRELEQQNALLRQREDELEVQNTRFDTAMNRISQGLCFFSGDQKLVICNERYAEMYRLPASCTRPGTALAEIVEQRFKAGSCPDMTLEEYLRWRDAVAVSNRPSDTTVRLQDGRTFAIHHEPMPDGGWVATHEDVSERQALSARLERQNELLKEHEQQLKTQNLQLDAALNNMSHGLCMFDAEHRLVVCNERYAQIYGLPPELRQPGTPFCDILSHRISNRVYAGEDQALPARDLMAIVGKNAPLSKVIELRDGRSVVIKHQPMPGGGWVATHEDVTEQQRIEARIQHMAHHDALTDLPNRVLLLERLDTALRAADGCASLAVLWLDLDRFKEVNDTLGHSVGDSLLNAVGDRLRGCVRERDTVARLGGDEFAIVQTGAEQPVGATALALRLIEAISAPYQINDHQIVIGTSIGISVCPIDATAPEELLTKADLALYRAKNDGRGTYRFFEPGMDARMHARRKLELDLRKALVDNAFELHYQPILDLDRNEVTTFEALLRWNHPERGSVPPSEFIPLAEETGLISSIGEWVLRRACADASSWPPNVSVAVNLSALQFKDNNLVELLFSALAAGGLDPRRLEVEITESVLLENTEAAFATLQRLRQFGVRVSLDDFGTGYSSLSYLRRFAFDKVKIDQSFIQNIDKEPRSHAIIQAILGLGASLDVVTVAEGVETRDQLDYLRAYGCTEVQGYYLSPPKPLGYVGQLLASVPEAVRLAA